MRAVFMGSPAFALPALQSLVSSEYDVIAVYTQPDKKSGRGQQVMSCPVKQYALSRGLNTIQPESFRDPQQVEIFAALKPDIVVVAAYGQILPEDILSLPRYGCLNIHPSLLPKYRGPSPIAAAILNGDAASGVTIMLIEKKIDSGPILNQVEEAVEADDTAERLSDKLAVKGAELLMGTIPEWILGQITPKTQDDSRASYTKMAVKEDGEMEWRLPAVQLWRKVRAYQPWPGCYTSWKGLSLQITSAVPIAACVVGHVGEIKAMPRTTSARVAIQTGDGLLGIVKLRPEGKREMTAEEFAAGHRDFIGSIL